MSKIRLYGDTSGYVDITAPAVAGTTSLALPASSGTVATTADIAAVGSASSWELYTPTWANFTVGNATQQWYYTQMGKTVIVRGLTQLGSTSSMGSSPTITLPVAARTDGYVANISAIGQAILRVAGSSWTGDVYFQTATIVGFYRHAVSGSQVFQNTVTSTTPATWASGDMVIANFFYEAA